MIRRPPRSTLFPTRRSSDLAPRPASHARTRSAAVLRAPRAGRGERPQPARSRAASGPTARDRKSTRLNSSHLVISYAVFCLKKKKKKDTSQPTEQAERETDV